MYSISSRSIEKLLKRPYLSILIILCFVTVFYYSDSLNSTYDFPLKNTLYKNFIGIKHKPNETLLKKFTNPINSTQLKLSALENAEKVSNIAGHFYKEYSSYNSTHFKPKENVTYCKNVHLTSPAFLQFNNEIWQVYNFAVNHTDYKLYLYSAFFDNRSPGPGAKIRVILSSNHQKVVKDVEWKCLIWFDGSVYPTLTDGDARPLWPEAWSFGFRDGVFGPLILSCKIPESYRGILPRAVSIQYGDNCNQFPKMPTNILRIEGETKRIRNESKGLSVGFCCKGFRYGDQDIGQRLIEWLEIVRQLKADKVYLYTYGLTGRMERILNHYQDEDGLVEFRRLKFPGEQMNIDVLYNFYYDKAGSKMWPQEVMELNECLYRNMARHDYIAVFDMDELIVPVQDRTWPELLQRIENQELKKNKTFDYVVNRHTFVLEEKEEDTYVEGSDPTSSNKERIPDYLFMMKHTYRSGFKKSPNFSPKSFFRTSSIMSIHNHLARNCWKPSGNEFGPCTPLVSDPNTTSRMFHFRHNRRVTPGIKCSDQEPDHCVYEDRSLWRYYKDVRRSVEEKIKLFYT